MVLLKQYSNHIGEDIQLEDLATAQKAKLALHPSQILSQDNQQYLIIKKAVPFETAGNNLCFITYRTCWERY
jgi:hypothetical protein